MCGWQDYVTYTSGAKQPKRTFWNGTENATHYSSQPARLVHNTQGTKSDFEKWFKKLDDPMVWWVQIIDEEGKEIGSKKPGKGTIVWRAAKRAEIKRKRKATCVKPDQRREAALW